MLNKLLIFIWSLFGVLCVQGNQVCYEEIGCFSNESPFYDPPLRPVSWLPESREEVGTQFLLNTRRNPSVPDVLSTSDINTVTGSNFHPSRKTIFVCHGYTESGDVGWMQDMVTALLNNGNHNVIRVDWHPGATAIYGKATANTRIVGAEIALLINNIKSSYGITGNDFHIVGHSLGAHVAGYAGERISDLGRITGLDAAGPYFEGTDPMVRLDPTDATFVDVLHTDANIILTTGAGIMQPVGHVDIYMNGGKQQPACDQGIIETIGEEDGLLTGTVYYVACNHLIVYDYFIESATDDLPWLAYECDGDWDDFKNGECFDTTKVARAGFYGDEFKPEDGRVNIVYYMRTHDETPLGGYQYKVSLYFPNPRKAQRHKGDIYVTLIGVNSITESIRLTDEAMVLEPDNTYSFIGFCSIYPGSLVGVQLRWEYDPDWYKWWDWDLFVDPEIYVNRIDVTDGQDGTMFTFCGSSSDGIEANKDIVNFVSGSSC